MSIKSKIKNLVLLLKEEKKIVVPTQVNTTELLKNKVALITGGSGGIGMAIAESFLKNGAKVIIAGTNEKKLNNYVSSLISYDGCVKHILLNVLEVDSIPTKISEASQLFGKVDILVNCAGVINKSDFMHTSVKEYDHIMDINVKGTYFMCQAMSKYMIDNQIKGHILNVSSASALRPAWTPYQISKWAIKGFTLGLADTLLPHGIIVNAIGPGPVATSMLGKENDENINNNSNPSGRFIKPEEIANLATFMVSDMGSMIVGDTYYITGGGGTISMHR